MVIFGPNDLAECMKLGREAAKRVTTLFIRPISLEFEKCYWPYVLISKKRYAGLFWTKPDKFDKLDAKGLESVRRDNCPLVRRALDTTLRKVLMERDVPGAIAFVKQLIADLLQDKMDLSQLIITKQLKDDYTNRQPHAELAERMRQRDPATAPNLGDRVPYVIVKGDKGAKLCERAEDPLYVMDHDVPVDTHYYLENQLRNPLTRIFSALMDRPESLFTGEHTRSVVIHTAPAATNKGGSTLMRFVKVKPTCLSCRAPLNPGEQCLCAHCGRDAPAVFRGFLQKLRTKEKEYARLWTQCQSCQGSMHQEVLCSAADCPIFYVRIKVKKELERHRATVNQFEDLTW